MVEVHSHMFVSKLSADGSNGELVLGGIGKPKDTIRTLFTSHLNGCRGRDIGSIILIPVQVPQTVLYAV